MEGVELQQLFTAALCITVLCSCSKSLGSLRSLKASD